MNNEEKTNFDLYNDFTYTEAKWNFVNQERQDLYNKENKIINAFDPNKEDVSIDIKVSYPFDDPYNVYDNFIGSRGSSGRRYIDNGYEYIEVIMIMPKSTGEYNFNDRNFYFQPYFEGNKFGFDNNNYYVPPINEDIKLFFE